MSKKEGERESCDVHLLVEANEVQGLLCAIERARVVHVSRYLAHLCMRVRVSASLCVRGCECACVCEGACACELECV